MLTSTTGNHHHEPPRFSEDIDSTCSSPYVSAPSSPAHFASSLPSGYFFSAPASPMHFLLSKGKDEQFSSMYESVFCSSASESPSFEFDFSSRLSSNGPSGNGSMSSADELFLNGKIRPMKLSSHLQMPQVLAPLGDLDGDGGGGDDRGLRGRDLGIRNMRYVHRKTRSMSPFRTTDDEFHVGKNGALHGIAEKKKETETQASEETTPSGSASSSRSSSTGRNNSKKWMFLKDLLRRSKSESRVNNKDRFWSAISFSSAKDPSPSPATPVTVTSMPSSDKKRGKNEIAETQKQKKGRRAPAAGKPANGVWKRRVPPSAHELHYTANRAQAEEMKKKTFLPYRQGLLGFLGFSSKNCGRFNAPTRIPNPVSLG